MKLVLLPEHYSRNLFHVYWLFDSNRTERSCTSLLYAAYYTMQIVYTDIEGLSHFAFA